MSYKEVEVVVKRALGSKVTSFDHYEYIDFCLARGSLLQGHAHRNTVLAIKKTAERGISCDGVSREEFELKDLVLKKLPFAEELIFVSSEDEALRCAIRVAQKKTKKAEVIFLQENMNGCCGEMHPVLSLDGLSAMLSKGDNKIACVVLEPITMCHGVECVSKEKLEEVKALCNQSTACLIFDERRTCFRQWSSSAQIESGIFADLTVLGGVLGAGFPLGAVVGSADLLKNADCCQKEIVSNRVICAGAFAQMRSLSESVYKKLNDKSINFQCELNDFFSFNGYNFRLTQYGSMFGFQSVGEIGVDQNRYAELVNFLKENGVLFPSYINMPFFISARHSKKDCVIAIELIKQFFNNEK